MKFFALFMCCGMQILFAESKIIPERFPQPCSKSEPNYSECTLRVLKKMGPHFLKGVREFNFPKMTPLDIPQFVVNRTLNNLVSINAVLKNLQMWGFDQLEIQDFKFDPKNMNGEFRMNLPQIRASFEFEVTGRLLENILNNAGYFKGNFTNVNNIFKFSLKQIDKLGVQYYAFEDFKAQGVTEDGFIALVEKNPENQATADVLVNFVNKNFRLSSDAIQPIYEESLQVFYKFLAELVLNTVPAQELIPE